MTYSTAELHDAHAGEFEVAEQGLRHYGARHAFHGTVKTLLVLEDFALVREAVSRPGDGQVLVVDGGGSMRCALLGDRLAAAAAANGWAGVIINGCIRDSAEIATIELGVMALGTSPVRSRQKGSGEADVSVRFAGVTIAPGSYVYADDDGLLVTDHPLPTAAD